MKLTRKILKTYLNYNAKTGVWRWVRSTPNSSAKAGALAGNINNTGYLTISIFGRAYLAHRLAWFYVKGRWPKHDVDHKNTKRDDNRFRNLRAATKSENLGNSKKRKDNKTGYKGVSFRRGKWVAYIGLAGRNRFLGSFSAPEKAHVAYLAAAKKQWGRFARNA